MRRVPEFAEINYGYGPQTWQHVACEGAFQPELHADSPPPRIHIVTVLKIPHLRCKSQFLH
jgi:hypothetical protein